jgi:hypothetical protein
VASSGQSSLLRRGRSAGRRMTRQSAEDSALGKPSPLRPQCSRFLKLIGYPINPELLAFCEGLPGPGRIGRDHGCTSRSKPTCAKVARWRVHNMQGECQAQSVAPGSSDLIFPTSRIFPSGRTISYVRIASLCLTKPGYIRREKPRPNIIRSVAPNDLPRASLAHGIPSG